MSLPKGRVTWCDGWRSAHHQAGKALATGAAAFSQGLRQGRTAGARETEFGVPLTNSTDVRRRDLVS